MKMHKRASSTASKAKLRHISNSVSPAAPRTLLIMLASIFLVGFSLSLVGCVEEPPSRDEIPLIKAQLVDLEKFYLGEYRTTPDSLLTQRFYAEMGKRGKWEALVVDGELWPFDGFANRSFFYTKKVAEVELSFRYKNPTTKADSLVPAKIRLNYERGKWLVENITPVEPLIY